MIRKSDLYSIVAFIVALLIFFRCQPYFLWRVEDFSRIASSILIPLLCFRFIDLSKKNIIVFLLFFFSFLIVGIIRGSDLLRLINLCLLAFIPVLKRDFIYETYNYFKLIFAFFLFLSIVVYTIVITTQWKYFDIIEPLNILKEYKYFSYPFLVIPTAEDLYFRFHGMFDEPGVVGTFGGLIMAIEGFKIKNWKNLIILIAGLLSFSFYFYIILLFVPIYKLSGKYKILIIILYVFVYILSYNNSTLYGLIWYRFSFDVDSNTLAGMNRGEEQIKEILKAEDLSSKFFFGHGYEASEEFLANASIFLTIYREGFLFVLLNLIAYITSAYHKLFHEKGDFILFVLILLATFYQRPGLFDVVYIFLFSTMIYKYIYVSDNPVNDINNENDSSN